MKNASEPENGLLWAPDDATRLHANLNQFINQFHQHLGVSREVSFSQLHSASIRNPGVFWKCVWDFCQIRGEQGGIPLDRGNDFLDWRWFPQARLNYAEALLKPHRLANDHFGDSIALICHDEIGNRVEITRRGLIDQVGKMAGFFQSRGIRPGDRIAALIPNIAEAIIAMLAASAIGAIWSSCSPEFGEDAICDRFGQIEPKLLISANRSLYNHKPVDCLGRIARVLPRLPTVQTLVVVGRGQGSVAIETVAWEQILVEQQPLLDWDRFPFGHPLCILYSSGTTGVPKCIVHGAGGTLLQHAKEHALHCDIHPGDRLFYYTTTGWMMWNWLAGALACDATICLFDGSPLANGWETLWRLAESENLTHFGASARYFSAIEKDNAEPGRQFSLPKLRAVFSTGSPLLPESFDWIYSRVKADLNLASISGGTDIVSCFVLGNPCLPVYRGQIQCKGLGMDVHIYDEFGQPLIDQAGELVCTTPFPSMPVGFWNDPDGARYRAAYFERFPGIWCHGDWALETPEGGFVIFGRSDATLNPGGVRIGTAELYRQVEAFPEIAESLATVLKGEGDERIVLFVKMRDGVVLTAALIEAVKQRLRQRCSPRHVPVAITQAQDLPRTISGKLSEIAVRNAINGANLGNQGALANPECLGFFQRWNFQNKTDLPTQESIPSHSQTKPAKKDPAP